MGKKCYKFSWILENDVWIGSNAIILQGTKVGNGAVVTKDIPPYSVGGGVPAKVIRRRLGIDIIENLEKNEWWNQDIEWIEKYAVEIYEGK